MDATNWNHTLQFTSPVVYRDHTIFMLLHCRKEDIPNWSFEGAPQYLTELYKFLVLVRQIFISKGCESDMFMLQLESFIPSPDKEQRAKLSPGVIFIFTFKYDDVEEHFEAACEAALAIGNGWKLEEEVTVHEEWNEMADRLQDFNSVTGLGGNVKARRKAVKDCLPTIKTQSSLDGYINQYVMHHESEESYSRSWKDRFDAFNDSALFKRIPRLKELYNQLSNYAAWRNGQALPATGEGSLEFLKRAASALKNKGTPDPTLERFMKLFTWKVIDNSGEGTTLDLSDYIAWRLDRAHVEEDKGFFLNNKFYEFTMHESFVRKGIKALNKRRFGDDEVDQERKKRRVAHNIAMDHRDSQVTLPDTSDFKLLYPVLSDVQDLCRFLASDEDGDITAYFTQHMNSEFMLNCLEEAMKSCKVAGVARKKQYDYVEALYELFPHGYLNGIQNLCIQRSADVEPSQDIMVQHLYTMMKANGIRQLGVEFCMMLMANIISFTVTNNKPMIAINGPPGTGKSHTAKAVGRICRGTMNCWNNSSFEAQDYFTIKSMAATRDDPYERVTGTCFLEEWRSNGSGGENLYAKDTTLEATTLKNIWDKGIIVNERCIKKEKTDQITSDKQTSLFSRCFVILANGLCLANSLRDRFLVYDVPDLQGNVHYMPEDKGHEILTNSGHIQMFSLIRFLISEGINRRAIGLTIKEKKLDSDLDEYETRLTFMRMKQVLKDMGYEKGKLDCRKEKQILLFAETFARYRAVLEVLSFSHGNEARTKEEDVATLAVMTKHAKELMIEERTILDPADIISAATMVLEFTDLCSKVLSTIVEHLLDPLAVRFLDNVYYLRMDTTLKAMVNELKSKKCGLLLQTLTDSLSDLECRKTEGAVPVPVVQRLPSTVNRERFDLCVEAETAAKSYCESRADLVQQAEEFMVQTILQSVNGVSFHMKDVPPGLLRVHDDHLVFSVPEELVRTFAFFKHLPNSGCEHVDGKTFKVHADFGMLRVKVAKALLRKHLQSAIDNPQADQDGYFTIYLPGNLKPLFALPNLPRVKTETVQPLIEGERVHLMGMTDPGLCSKILPNVNSVRKGYVDIDSLLQTEGETPTIDKINVEAFVLSTPERMKVHVLVLDEWPLLHGQPATRESQAHNFVTRMMCRDMTSMSTVLCIDRESCYATEKPEDAFCFVKVPPNAELPEFWVRNSEFGVNGGVNKRQERSMNTFSRDHRDLKLAYKQVIRKGLIRELRRQCPPRRDSDGSPIFDTTEFVKERLKLVMEENVAKFTAPKAAALVPYPLSMIRLGKNM